MRVSEKQIGKALEMCRERYCKQPNYMAGAIAGFGPDSYRRRERGQVSLKLSELLRIAEAWQVDPLILFSELLAQCGSAVWAKLAIKLSCSPIAAQRRFEEGQRRYGYSFGQLWELVQKDQVRI